MDATGLFDQCYIITDQDRAVATVLVVYTGVATLMLALLFAELEGVTRQASDYRRLARHYLTYDYESTAQEKRTSRRKLRIRPKRPSLLLRMPDLATTLSTAADMSRHVWFQGRSAPPSMSQSTAYKTLPGPLSTICYVCKARQRTGTGSTGFTGPSSGITDASTKQDGTAQAVDAGASDNHEAVQAARTFRRRHGLYTSMCARCGSQTLKRLFSILAEPERIVTPPVFRQCLAGYRALVIGGRTKIGYQVALRLLRTGATVIVTTRFPDRCLFAEEPDANVWLANLSFVALDMNVPAPDMARRAEKLAELAGLIDGLWIVAAQTMRGSGTPAPAGAPANRYGDPAHHMEPATSSWRMGFTDVSPEELEEVVRVNTVGPYLLLRAFIPRFLGRAPETLHKRRAVVVTHAREGLMNIRGKSPYHPHTNVAKAGEHMVTHMAQLALKGRWPVYGIDPGWISLDEYCAEGLPMHPLPLTELDGAAKLTEPVLGRGHMPGGTRGTIQHGDFFTACF